MRTVYHNGKIYTGKEMAEAFAVEDSLFVFVGKDAEALRLPADEYVDLQGRFVCAGFNDSHLHLLNYGHVLMMAHLYEHTSSLKELLDYLQDFLHCNPYDKDSWLLGRGWNQDLFTDTKRTPCKDDLDALSKDIPIMLTRACGHICVVNSRALQAAGITRDTPDPAGGTIDYDQGILAENAIELLKGSIPLPDKKQLKTMLRTAMASLNSYGITSVQSDDYIVFKGLPYTLINEAFRELITEGTATVRVYEQCNFPAIADLERFLDDGNAAGKGDEMFRLGPLKIVADGSLGARTAHLSRPYHDDPSTSGLELFTPEQLQELIDLANKNDMQIAVHAIGDACLDHVLDAYAQALEKHPRQDPRHGIVHCQISRQDQLDRMVKMKMHIYAQSVFLDYDNHIVADRVGQDLAATSYNWKYLLNKGLCVSNGSDAPVEIPDVLKGIQCAMTRTSLDGCGPYLADQAFTVKEALDSFTSASARASFEEDRKGLIADGYLADFVILEKDPFITAPHEIHQIAVLATYLDGCCVYCRENRQ